MRKRALLLNMDIKFYYIDAQKDFPPNNIPLETEAGSYVFLKSDVFKGIYWYALKGMTSSGMVALPVEVVKQVQKLNRSGIKPEKLVLEGVDISKNREETFTNMVNQEDLDRFNQPQKRSARKKNRKLNRNIYRNPKK